MPATNLGSSTLERVCPECHDAARPDEATCPTCRVEYMVRPRPDSAFDHDADWESRLGHHDRPEAIWSGGSPVGTRCFWTPTHEQMEDFPWKQ